MKRLVSCFLAICMLFALAACGKDDAGNNNATNDNDAAQNNNVDQNSDAGKNNDVSSEPQKLTVGSTNKVTLSFDGANEANTFGFALCCDMLVYIDTDGEVKSHILESWESADEGLTMTLKEGVTFTDGKPCTAADILFTFRDANERGMGSKDWVEYFDWDNAEISNNDLTLFIPTPEPYAAGIVSLTRTSAYIKSEAFLEEHPFGDEIWWDTVQGTGPYECVEQVDGAYSLYKLRDNYWGDEEFVYDEIQFNYYSDQNAMAIELQNGVIDCALDISAFYYNEFSDDSDYTTKKHGEGNIVCVAFDEKAIPAFQNEKVREAISLAFNADEAGIIGAEGMYEVAESILPKSSFGYKSTGAYLNGSEADIERAKELMAEAGYADGFDCTLTVRDNFVGIGEVVQGALSKIGIRCEFEALEFMNFIMKNRSNEIELTVAQVQSDNSGEPADIYSNFMTTQDADLGVIFEDDFNELCNKANTTVDPVERQKLVEEIQDYIYEGNYRVYLYEQQKGWVYKVGTLPEDFECYWGNIPGGFRLEK